ncbi:MAG TPA: c-type cytochrome [Opitutaceae bacterium]
MKRRAMRGVMVVAALAAAGLIVAASGVVPIKASKGHWPITEWFLRFSMKRSIATHSLAVTVPDNLADPALVLKGASHYDLGCRACHGEPGMPRPRIASGMLPPPPDLVKRIQKSNPKKLFHVVKHGLKFTGMPAWPSPQRDDEVWAMVAFLLQYPELDAARYRALVQREPEAVVPLETAAPGERVPAAVAQSCVRCHGTDGLGRGSSAFPRIAGQRAGYLRHALEAYAAGRRHSGIMEPVAAAIPRESLDEVVRYYAGVRPRAPAGKREAPADDEAALARGRQIAQEGISRQRVPACVECHGPGARKGRAEYPSLAGQSAEYLQLQLSLFKDNRRGGSAFAHLMKPVASRLTPGQMRDVTLYFASLPPVPEASSSEGAKEAAP